MIAVHAVVPAAHAGDLRAALRESHQLLEVPESGARHGVAAVEHRLDRHVRHALPLGQLEQREQVRVDRMHAPRADQPDEVQRATIRDDTPACVHEHGVREEAAVLDRIVDPNEILLDDTTRAEVQVSDLAVAHLSAGQADRFLRRCEQRARRARPEAIPGRHVRHRDRVALALGAITPTVEDE